jgi:hypothetical protein
VVHTLDLKTGSGFQTSVFLSGELSPDFYFSKTLTTITKRKTAVFVLNRLKDTETCFVGEGVGTFLSTGCSFKSSLKMCRQPSEICLNPPGDARHQFCIRKLKNQTSTQTH